MPPKTRITGQMIIDAGLEIVRQRGHEQLNVRAIADMLQCSMRPVLYAFRTMDEIRDRVYQAADAYHTAFITGDMESMSSPMLALGLRYIRFGYEEPRLFRFLFETDRFRGMDLSTLTGMPEVEDIMAILRTGAECDEQASRSMFLTMFSCVHGLASLLANNTMAYDEQQCTAMLMDLYKGLMAVSGGSGNV